MDPAAKSIGRLRALLFGAVTVTAVLNGLVVYYGLRNAQQFYAGMEFKSLSTQAGQDIRKSFAQSGEALTYLAERYATTFPNEEDWPLVQLPGFVRDIPYLQASSGFEALLFVPVVKWEDVKRTERFLMDAWAANPLIPYFAGRYPLPGLYGLNETAGGMPYKDTTKVSWPAQYEVVLPVAQMLMDHGIPADVLGQDLHATGDFGPVFEDIMRCTGASPYSYAREKCSAVTSVDYAVTIVDYVATSVRTVTSNIAIPIMLNQNSSQLVGFVGGYFQWGKLITSLIPDYVSGIDIVLRAKGMVVTFGVNNGQAVFQSSSDTHGDRFEEFKYVESDIVISGSDTFTLEFYLQQDFMDARTNNTPLYLALGGALQILLCTLLFVLFDVPMRALRKDVVRGEIVLDTKRRFVRFVSHEIRTPMNAVRLGMTLFSTEIDGLGAKLAGKSLEEVMGLLQEIVADWRQIALDVLDNTEAAVDVLNDLLNYDKIETGSLKLEFTMVPVWKVLQRTFKTFVLQAREKGIVFQLQGQMFGADASLLVGDLGNLHCLGDETRITQVLRNLMSNSLKFTKEKGVVSVLAEYLPNGLSHADILQAPPLLLDNPRAGAVRITVQDDGAGLSPAQVGDICKEGVQFNANALQAGGGSGLGLFIGKGIAEQHGGTMRVSSEGLGKGATFVIDLPLFEVEGLEEPLTPDEAEDNETGIFTPLLPPVTKYLLVVDDATSNRKLLVRILTAKGYVCREAADGQQALDVYQQMCADDCAPCAVLMDYEMPVMNGPTATKHLREMRCESYIVGVTGNVMQEDMDVFHEHGADAVLAKPLRIEIFESMMASIFSKNSPRRNSKPNPLPQLSPRGARVYADNTQNV